MGLILKDLQFPIAKATIVGAIADPYWCDTYNAGHDKSLSWFVDVDTEPQEVEDNIWKPHVYHQSLHFPIRRWVELSGQVINWDMDAEEDEDVENESGFYVFEHEDISRATLQLLERDGCQFQLRWEGTCNIFWNDKYGENVPFSLETSATFTGIRVRGSEFDTDETMRERLGLQIDVDDFVQQPIQIMEHSYESGVKMAQTIFEPRW